MKTIDSVRLFGWSGKTNNTPLAKKLKKLLEEFGHTDVHVWWEQIGPNMEMCGHSGGFFFCSTEYDCYPIGLSFTEATNNIKTCNFLHKNCTSMVK